MLFRTELGQPGPLNGDGQIYNVIVTAHFRVIVFFFYGYSDHNGGFGN